MRYLGAVLAAAGLSLVAVGCGGSKSAKNLPGFVLNPPSKAGVLYGTGMATQESPQLAKETADLRAKKEIAKQLSQNVSNLMKDFMGQAGIGEEAEVTEFVQSVTKSITDVELVGCTVEKREYVDGTMYSLAVYPLDASMRQMINNAVNGALTSKQALLSEFRAKQGFEELEKELKKLEQKQQMQ